MGIAVEKLYLTNLGEENQQYLSDYKPIKGEDGEWRRPGGSHMLIEMAVPVIFGELTKDDEPYTVRVVASDKETGLYLICEDGYFGNEQYICNYKAEKKDDDDNGRHPFKSIHVNGYSEKFIEEHGFEPWQIHVYYDDHADMKHSEGPYNVTLERI